MTTHKMCSSVEYRAWLRIKTCCYNKNYTNYKTYGGHGIRVCKRWKNNFQNFLNDMGKAKPGSTSAELIDPDKDFCNGNCRWVTSITRRKKQSPKRKYKNPKTFSITIEQEFFDFLQRQAFEKSRELQKPISAVDLIKIILEENAPMGSQMNLFNKGTGGYD